MAGMKSRPVVYESEVKLRAYKIWRSRWMVLYGDGILCWFKSAGHCESSPDQPVDAIDLMEVLSVTNDAERRLQVHMVDGSALHLKTEDEKQAMVWMAVLNEKQSRLHRRATTLFEASSSTVHPELSVWQAYTSVQLISSSDRAKVYLARPLDSEETVHAIKVICRCGTALPTETEMRAWHTASSYSGFVIQIWGVYAWESHMAIAMEYVPTGVPLALAQHDWTVMEVKQVIKWIGCSLLLLHKSGISHRSVTTSNILVSTDEGLSPPAFKILPMNCQQQQAGREDRGMLQDVSSLAELMLHMLAGQTDINAQHLLRLLQADPEKRCSMQEAMLHPWLNDSEDPLDMMTPRAVSYTHLTLPTKRIV
eukprot:TRINITY_DN10857_c0_g3_i4.p1 TRINITY_DN10857_c0_g3~~TRINITY_DN10857_c0_g3_i4.p1  ORF type:complete len:366 (+),score=83.18 TRINITY_DN10857_c0_g3_i4:82-1179(+)